jgi:hypothetical protein
MSRAAAHVLAVSVVLSSLGLPGCGSDSPVTPTRAPLVQGQMMFPQPDAALGTLGVVNFTTTVRGDLEVVADWSSASNGFVVSIRQGTCSVGNQLDCANLAQMATKPARVTLANAPAASYTLVVEWLASAVPTIPDTVTYQVFSTS